MSLARPQPPRTAKREGVVVVTDNTGDFDKIRPLCAVKTLSGDDFFGPAT